LPSFALPPLERRVPPLRRALPLPHRSYGLMRQTRLALPSFGFILVRGVFAGRSQPLLPTGSSRRYLCESFLGCLIPYPGGSTKCFYLFLPLWHRPSPKKETGRLPQFLANTTFREAGFRGCRYFFMFRPPSLLVSQIVPTAAILPQGSRDFYFRAERASLPPHAPDMLTVRIQAIDGTRTFTLLDSQPCRLLILLPYDPFRKFLKAAP
jgi:hypothetical protein